MRILMGHSVNQQELIRILTDELPVLRAKLGLAQESLANKIGVSRQTVNAIEGKKREMSWDMFMALVLLFSYNAKTAPMLRHAGVHPEDLSEYLKVETESESRNL